MIKTIRTYAAYNERRYSDPWVAIVNPKTAKIDFSERVGGYTGARGKGEAGDLYIIDPQPGAIYAYGQKDYRNTKYTTVIYILCTEDGYQEIPKTALIHHLNDAAKIKKEEN
jgi:hypothetical protein